MASWSVYILRCGDDSLYTGISNDVAARLARHNAGKGARYTRSRLPVKLVWKRRVADQSAALKLELLLKALTRAEKLKLIRRRRRSSSSRAAR
jgi:putative endonuclease